MNTHTAPAPTFTNPLLDYGPDPWVMYQDGFYYYMHSTRTDLVIRKTRDLADLVNAEQKTVWTAPESGPYAKSIWSPELHCIDGVWYIYFSADDDRDIGEHRRMFIIENPSTDPFNGTWTFKCQLNLPDDKWAIDGTVFRHRGQLYFAWAGWSGDDNVQQNLYLCTMENPWTCTGERVLLSKPTLPWERHNHDPDAKSPHNHIFINEGPAPLFHGDRLFLVYSASGCWTDQYCLGMLTASADADLMDPAVWTKSDQPVFETSPENGVYAPGHNCFFKASDGEDWLLYHANPAPGKGCENERSPRMQPVRWRPDGTPDFGVPVATGMPLAGPLNERANE